MVEPRHASIGAVPGRSFRRGLALVLATAVVPSAALASDAAQQVFKDYAKDGRIDACAHSPQALEDASKQVPPDIKQYASDYPAAIRGAIEARARGDCDAPSATAVSGGAVTSAPGSSPIPPAS